jgi:hypothetical protein
MVARFVALRAEGRTLQTCADLIGVDCGTTLRRKARELGLNGRLNRGALPGAVVRSRSGAT